jgi:hypothetical protein
MLKVLDGSAGYGKPLTELEIKDFRYCARKFSLKQLKYVIVPSFSMLKILNASPGFGVAMIFLNLALILVLVLIATTPVILEYDPDLKCPEELPAPAECARQVLLTEVFATTDDNDDSQDKAISEKLQQSDDALLETAKEAYLNGSCIDSLDVMKLLTIQDLSNDELKMITEIKTC